MANEHVGMTVVNAITGQPLEVEAEVAVSSIAVRIDNDVYVAHNKVLSIAQVGTLIKQLERLCRDVL